MVSPQTLSEADRRILAVWAADCAERVLPLFEADVPDDGRPRDAIERARAFGSGELSAAGEIRRRFLAFRAAGTAATPAGAAAARAAAQAAAVAHMGAHALGAGAYAVKAAALADAGLSAVGAELQWQVAGLSPQTRSALRLLPPVGEDKAGPLGPGLLATGELGANIRAIQSAVSTGD